MVKTTVRLIRQLAYVLLVAAMLVTSFGTPSYAAPASNEAIFYTDKDYQGDKYIYLKGSGDQATCQGEEGELNDKFLSVEIGSLSKVLAWQHCDASGNYQEWTASKPDISGIEGLSRFKVIDTTDAVIAFRLVDDTNSPTALTLYLQTFGIPSDGAITDSTNDGNDDYRIIGILPTNAGGESNVTSVNLRNAAGEFLPAGSGSVYFKWNAAQNKAEYTTYPDTAPKGFEIKQTSPNTFEFHWVGA
ncbi:hypothetical protein JMG10_43195 [Nostoc ellipsosporum NOK]|nr:hypothetical protein [Nostoc ellipsosporum NOK]